MIVFDLECAAHSHRFEGWFKSSEDFADQQDRELVACPVCGSADVAKAPMAPHLSRKGNQAGAIFAADRSPVVDKTPATSEVLSSPKFPPEVVAAMRVLAKIQAEALKTSRWVGDKFADTSRAMHYGDADKATIHGQATREEAKDLLDEGIMVAPLLIPCPPPDEIN
ncbi:DUF1178 family protein [Novosphingobium sp. Gsoil 351]|uniref:DUF1178 family protein n=1 Tax=Novosphingobium sp. Gsoil 351 TaxID=2675225 RepID=UPI0012B4BEAA|nr:DUF1178 family protein [Novosphingobium sp. Gsoil 351]QGN53822.1 DUF1178 family protein [Novosphingobium sp. Gsoil 351]